MSRRRLQTADFNLPQQGKGTAEWRWMRCLLYDLDSSSASQKLGTFSHRRRSISPQGAWEGWGAQTGEHSSPLQGKCDLPARFVGTGAPIGSALGVSPTVRPNSTTLQTAQRRGRRPRRPAGSPFGRAPAVAGERGITARREFAGVFRLHCRGDHWSPAGVENFTAVRREQARLLLQHRLCRRA